MSHTAEPAAIAATADTDLLQFDGPVKRVWKSPFYLLTLSVVAAVMLLLPVIYFAMIAGVGYAVYWHATEGIAIFETPGTAWLKIIIYILPLMAGPILLLFMVKPIFARSVSLDRRVSLNRDNEPRLFAFVDAVCGTLGAVKPKRIDIDCDVNASASFRRGLLSLFRADLVLTIGMPLVAGLTLRQFAGVLAHEFGHFTQGIAMRLTFIIDRVNIWFARVVYERDSWDEWIVAQQKNADDWHVLIFMVSRLLVWVSRLTLWLLLHVAHAVSCVMSRQMEYDADRYQARLAGASQFDKTFDRMGLLDVAHGLVMDDLAEAWKDHRLGDDLPGLVAAKIDEMPKDLRQAIDAHAKKQKTRLFSTHPTNEARKKRVGKENAAGVFHVKGPASSLFMNFENACKGITRAFYRGALGSHFHPNQLISTEALKKRRQSIARAEAAAARYFCECLTLLRPLAVDPYSQGGKMPPKERLSKLRSAREVLSKSAPVMKKAYQRLIDAEDLTMKAQAAQLLAREGIKFDCKEFGIEEPTEECARKTLQQAAQIKESTASDIRKMEKVFRLRLECALALLKVDQVAQHIDRAEALLNRSRSLLSALSVVHVVNGELTELRNGLPELRMLDILASEDVEDESLLCGLIRGMDERNETVLELRRILKEHPYPFKHADGAVTLAQYAIPRMPDRRDVPDLHDLVVDCLDKMDTLYVRCMGELALIAEKVEAAVGLKVKEKAPPQRKDAEKKSAAVQSVAKKNAQQAPGESGRPRRRP